MNYVFDTWSTNPGSISTELRTEYLRFFQKPAILKSICAEYRATSIDIEHERNDSDNKKIIEAPALVLWSDNDFPKNAESPLGIWKNWCSNVDGIGLPVGHFLMEEAPEAVEKEMQKFFSSAIFD